MASLRGIVRTSVPGPIRRTLSARLRRRRRDGQHWVRVVMDGEIAGYLDRLDASECDAVEISGSSHSSRPWKSYVSLQYPAYDLLAPSEVGNFDAVICEQVLEHVRDPWTAMKSLAAVCRPGGHVIVSTPFMLRIHPAPGDYWRFTTDGIAELFRAAGLDTVRVASWGNAWCIARNHRRWAPFRPWHRTLQRWSLRNDVALPQVVWGFATRPPESLP